MDLAEPIGPNGQTSCLRSYGRAPLAVRTSLQTPVGRVRCTVLDLSLGGARLEIDQNIAVGESLILTLRKLQAFATVKWARGNVIGIQFAEKLPKALILSLRGEDLDPEELERVEAMLAARNWVVGAPVGPSKSQRLANVLGSQNERSGPVNRASPAQAPPSFNAVRRAPRAGDGTSGRVLLLALFSAAVGCLIGFASVALF